MDRRTAGCLLAVSLLAVSGCAERNVPAGADGTAVPLDGSAAADAHNKRDFHEPDSGGSANFCKGKAYAAVDGKPLQISRLSTYVDFVASCCGPAPVVDFEATRADGSQAKVRLYMANMPNMKPQPKVRLDLSALPKGWFVGVRCDPSSMCGVVSTSTSSFAGFIEIQSLLGGPAVQVTACVEISPKGPSNPPAHRIKLWSPPVTVNTACVPGMHQTCNVDPKISSLRGKCNDDSTCTCTPPAKKTPNGKCQ